MNAIQLEESTTARPVERRRRWGKRRDFDRVYPISEVAAADRVIVRPELYHAINICQWTTRTTERYTAEEPSVKHT